MHSLQAPGSRSFFTVLCLPGLCLFWRSAGSWDVSPGTLGSGVCSAGIVLPGPHSPFVWSRRLSCSGGPTGSALQPFTAWPTACGALSPGVHFLC